MTAGESQGDEVERFINSHIDSVPYLEAPLLLWNSRLRWWTVIGLAEHLYVKPDVSRRILKKLVVEGLVVSNAGNPEE